MKYLHKLNELVRIDNFSLDSLEQFVGQNKKYKDLLQDINDTLVDDKIYLMDRQEFDPWFQENMPNQPPPPPPMMQTYPGVNFLAYFPQASEDVFIITLRNFISNFRNERTFKAFKDRIEPLIVHELIHTKQAAQKDLAHVPEPDVSDFASYVSSPDELMAWSNTIAHEIFAISRSMPTDLIRAIRGSRSGNMVDKHFPDKDDPIRKKFIKYIYQYLDELVDKEKENPTKEIEKVEEPIIAKSPVRKKPVRKKSVQKKRTRNVNIPELEAQIDAALDEGDFQTFQRLSKKLNRIENG